MRIEFALAIGASVLAACATAQDEPIAVRLPAALGGGQAMTVHAAATGSPVHHGTGAMLPPTTGSDTEPVLSVPSSVDLSSEAPPPGDQGDTGSCTTWSSAHSALGWWANHDGYTGATFAPMFLYSQIVAGNCDNGSYVEHVLGMMKSHGVDTQTDYEPMQFDLDCATQPTSAQKSNAGRFKITGYKQSNLSGGVQKAIEATLAAGRPAILSIQVYPEFDGATSSSYLVGPPSDGESSRGGHAIAAFAYDENGVWILNSWGTGWGNGGWAELSWEFVNGNFGGQANVGDVASITGIAFDASDANASCPLWAFEAQCQANPSYMLSSCSLSCANPSPTFASPAEWFHIQNVALGGSYSLDTGVIAATGNYSGQWWELSPLGGGYYRLTNSYQGEGMAFDTWTMAQTGNYSGQYWLLEPITDGVYRLTNEYLGQGTSLAVNTHTLAIESDPTADDPTQYWEIFEAN
ncbi:MAG TPA: C1 family peptidase [Kofleriaceae bacterium]|nr:C1 family peptidase [Kofleriaceae bacterium]